MDHLFACVALLLCGATANEFQLPREGVSKERTMELLDSLQAQLDKQRDNFLGFQGNANISYSDVLGGSMSYMINNIGDPFHEGAMTINTKQIEEAVVHRLAAIWHNKIPPANQAQRRPDPEGAWGYVSHGGTEGNIYGFYNGREYLSGRRLVYAQPERSPKKQRFRVSQGQLWRNDDGEVSVVSQEDVDSASHQERCLIQEATVNDFTPIAFFSDQSHYSILKAVVFLKMDTFHSYAMDPANGIRDKCLDVPVLRTHRNCTATTWPTEIPSNWDGSIDIDALYHTVEFFAQRGHPPFMSLNYGTTFKGAYDNVSEVLMRLKPMLEKYCLWHRKLAFDGEQEPTTRTGYWLHVDGALGASYMPFLRAMHQDGELPQQLADYDIDPLVLQDASGDFHLPEFDFRLPIHSIVMSGHKFPGAPFPCGVYVSKLKYLLQPPRHVDYIGAPDTTFGGSRSGHGPLVLWTYLAQQGDSGIKAQILRQLHLVSYALRGLTGVDGVVHWVQRHCDFHVEVYHSPSSLSIVFSRVSDELLRTFSIPFEFDFRRKVQSDRGGYYSHMFMMDHVTEQRLDRLFAELKQCSSWFGWNQLQSRSRVCGVDSCGSV